MKHNCFFTFNPKLFTNQHLHLVLFLFSFCIPNYFFIQYPKLHLHHIPSRFILGLSIIQKYELVCVLKGQTTITQKIQSINSNPVVFISLNFSPKFLNPPMVSPNLNHNLLVHHHHSIVIFYHKNIANLLPFSTRFHTHATAFLSSSLRPRIWCDGEEEGCG